jgi:flagellar hook-associated protein FlgK
MNESLATLQDTLARQHKKLRDAIPTAPDAAARQALLTEMSELTHRVQIVGSLLFRAQTQALTDKIAEVNKATKKVNAAIKQIQALKGFLDAVSGFLTLVDEAIDIAKKVL